jgi:MoxR-like ATPase
MARWLRCFLSSHHVLIVGPPGTAKSMLADEICRRIEARELFSVAPHPLHDSGRDLWRREPSKRWNRTIIAA